MAETSFEEMAANFQANFGVKLSEEQKQQIRGALARNDYGALNRLTGLSAGMGDYECPISAWGIHGMSFHEADIELNRRVQQAVSGT